MDPIRGSVAWIVLAFLSMAGSARTSPPPQPAPAPMKAPALTAEQLQDLTKQVTAKNLRAQQAAADDDFTTARQLRKEILDTWMHHFDANDWRVVDARVLWQSADQIAGLTPEQRQQYKETREFARLGAQLPKEGRYRESLSLYQKALAGWQKLLGEDNLVTLNSYLDVARILTGMQQYGEADLLYRQVLGRAEKLYGTDHPTVAGPCIELALNLARQNKYAQAEPFLRRALTLQQKSQGEYHPSTASSYDRLANNLYMQGKHASAEPMYRAGLSINRKLHGEEHLATAVSYGYIAQNLYAQKKYVDADPIFRRTLEINRNGLGEQHRETGHAYFLLAKNLDAQEQHAEAEPLHRQALAIYVKTLSEQHAQTANCRVLLGINLFAQRKVGESIGQLRQALASRQKLLGDDHPDTMFVANRLATFLATEIRPAEAEPLCRRVLAHQLAKFGEQDPSTVESYRLLADILTLQGKHVEAELLLRRLLAVNLKMYGEDQPATLICTGALAKTLDVQKKFAESEPLLRQVLAASQTLHGQEHVLTADAYSNLATSLNRQHKHTDAEPLFRRALGIRRKVAGKEDSALASACYSLAQQLYQLENYPEAEALLRESLAICVNVFGEKHALTGGVHLSLAGVLRDRGEYDRAAAAAQASLRAFRSARQGVGFTGLDRSSYSYGIVSASFVAALLARSGQPMSAWQHLEENLALSLFEDMMVRSQRQLSEAELARQDDLRSQLHQLDKQISLLSRQQAPTDAQRVRLDALQRDHNLCQAEWGQFHTELQKKYGEGNSQVYDLRRIQTQLPAGAALVVWIDFKGSAKAKDPNGEHWACLIRSTGEPVWVRMPGSGPGGAWTKDDEKLPDQVREVLRNSRPSNDDWQALTEQFHQQRFTALQKHLDAGPNRPAITHLIVLPSAAMVGIPVEVLTRTQSISYAPSGTLFAMLQERKPSASKRLLALGDPTFVTRKPANPQQAGTLDLLRMSVRGGSFKPLPGTRREVEAITALFPDAVQLLGSNASEQRLDALADANRLREFRYVHLATHGQANAEQGLHSFLALANDRLPDPLALPEPGHKLYDGRLTAAQMLNWQLDADLVTLSACETGLGQQQGDDYLGFAQPLLLAGSRSLVVSLWKVDDNATSLLMQRFYQNLLGRRPGLEKPLDRAAALAEAKQWLRQLSSEEVARLLRTLSDEVRGPETEGMETIERARPYEHPSYWAGFILIGAPGDVTQARPVLTVPPAVPRSEPPTVLAVVTAEEPAPLASRWPWVAAGGAAAVMLLGGLFCCWRLRRR